MKCRKIVGFLLIAVLLLSTMSMAIAVNADESVSPEFTPEHQKIGVAIMDWDQNTLMLKNYYDNYLAKEFDCEFVYSDLCKDVGACIAFIENCASMGIKALISLYVPAQDDRVSIAAKCQEYGIWYCQNDAAVAETLVDFPVYCVGGADPGTVAAQFAEMTETVLGNESTHNVILNNGFCFIGNEQHIQTAIAILKTVCEKYGIDLGTDDYRSIVTTTVTRTEYENADGVKLMIEPTMLPEPDTYYSILKDGVYDCVFFTGPVYLRVESAINEIEKLTGNHINMIAIAAVTDTTRTSFSANDETGVATLDAALIKNCTSAGVLFMLAYNCLTGHAEDLRIDERPILYDSPMWVCYGLDDFESISQLDADNSSYYSWTADDIKECLFVYNPDITAEGIAEICAAKFDLNSVLEENGLSVAE